ncbi:MAG: AEC family transporter [Candidatus Bathyarchaeota archaeon]|nr:AEC family transporter [Candidatus Bathyarchaeota archaeon]MDH5787540.1 AEC family transporter [Candidatus Bathyarchaeota archaeon]
MDNNIAIRTIVPILLLIGIGFLSRKIGILKSGDERVLSAYVYFFALPALFFVDLAEIDFTAQNLTFILVGIIPIFLVLVVYTILYLLSRFSRNTFYLLIISTVFGSLAFFGLPFIMFAFPAEIELATLSAASISIISVPISITVLELYKLEKSTVWEGIKRVTKRLSRNPLIISILLGVVFSVVGIEIPYPVTASLRMLGGTTSTVAIFMLGVFFYGRKYTNLATAFKLSLLRMLFLPTLAILTIMLFGLGGSQRAILLVMHAVPVAISNIVLSERYNFYKETIASLILISTLGAGLYLNLWLLLFGYG